MSSNGWKGWLTGKVSRPNGNGKTPAPIPEVTGWDIEDYRVDEDEALARAIREWELTERWLQAINNQTITFERGPVAITGLADHHFGDSGVNYPLAFEEAELVASTPGMYTFLVGDLVNQFIIGTLRAARDGARLNILDEWAITRRLLRLLMPKLLGSVGGNHEHWHTTLTGVDYFEDLLRWQRRLHQEQKRPLLYDAHEVYVTIKVGAAEYPTCLRHKWRGRSMYNPTHGIERGMRERGDFILGFGAHTHEAGISRHTWIAGRCGAAVQLGSYKRSDPYARRLGFGKANPSCGVAVILDEEGHITLPSNLREAAALMSGAYGREVVHE